MVFDLDGTLVDSAPSLQIILNEMRTESGKSALPLLHFQEWSSIGGLALIQNALELDATSAARMLVEFRHRYAALPTPEHSLYPAVSPLLSQLASRAMRMAICSNKPLKLCQKVLRDLGLIDFLPIIVGGDSLKVKKPDKSVLEHTVRLMNLDIADVLFVGDSIVDYQTARNAGCRFAIFEGGYTFDVDLEACDFRFKSFLQLSMFLSGGAND